MQQSTGDYAMPHLILIGGGSGSGKTTIVRDLKKRLSPKSVTYYSHDNYYKDLSHLSPEEQEKYNFDHPDAINSNELIEDLHKLLNGESIEIPVYDYATYTRKQRKIPIQNSDIILLEGIFSLYYKGLADMAKLKIYVDTEPDMRLRRRIKRDISERGYSLDAILKQYINTVKPMHEKYIGPTRENADIILDGSCPVNDNSNRILAWINDIL